MNGFDLDTLLDGFTDAQIKAYLARRALAREEKRKAQTAARMCALRTRNSDAASARTVTHPVTQQNGDFQRKSDAVRDAEVTPDVTRTVTHPVTQVPSPSPALPPGPPIPPAPTPTLSPARVREDADIFALIPATLRTGAFLAEWPQWVDHCRTHADHRVKAYTKFTVRQQLAELERMGPDKALRALQVSGQKGSASIIDPDEQRFGKFNGAGPPGGGHGPAKTKILPTAKDTMT